MPLQVVLGSTPSVECDFRLSGVLTDPASVVAIVRAPSGDATTYTYPATGLTRDSTGIYRIEFIATQSGSYWVRFEGAGVVEAVNEISIQVQQSNVI